MQHHTRHVVFWKLLRPLVIPVVWLVFHFRGMRARLPGPSLVLCNHNTDWDPLLVGCSFPDQFYFVSSEHVLRAGLAGRLIRALLDPIPRQKSGSAADTVMAVLRRIKQGCSVCIFPEGNRSWDGAVQPFPAATGKLARTAAAAGASLVTYRLEGAYFANPRWAGTSLRRGAVRGRVVRTYSPQELRAMSPAAINEAIRADIGEDAYAAQRRRRIPFRGRRLAEHLETLFFLCPRCGGVHTLRSRGDLLRCDSCGLTVRYRPDGFLEGDDLPWDNIRDWNLWQTERIKAMCDEAGEEPVFTDGEMCCWEIEKGRSRRLLEEGDMTLYRDRLELPGVTLPLSEIRGVALRGPQDIYFSTEERTWQVSSRQVRCTVRYLTAISHLNGVDYGV